MSNDEDPLIRRLKLRTELRDLRAKSGKTRNEVAESMLWSVSKLLRIENGNVDISLNDLKALLDYYGLTSGRKREDLLATITDGRFVSTWRSDFKELYPEVYLNYLEFEARALRVYVHTHSIIADLLQTGEYGRALLLSKGLSEDKIAQLVHANELRRQRHDRDMPRHMRFLLGEAALRWRVGGPAVMRRQLEMLVATTRQPHISLRIVPFDRGAYPDMHESFHILDLDTTPDPDVVLVGDTPKGSKLLEKPEQTAPYAEKLQRIESQALSKFDSIRLVQQHLAEL